MNFSKRESSSYQVDQVSARPDAASLVHEKVISLLGSEKPGRLLDVPAGEGAFAERARELGHEVWCGDIDPSRFRAKSLECAQIDLNSRWPYTNNMFDYVVCIEVVEHLEDPWRFVREANRALKTEGKFFLTTPNVLTIKSRLSYLFYGYTNYFHQMVEQGHEGEELPVDHINPVSFLELRHILVRNGFRIQAIEANRYQKRSSLTY